MTLVRIFKSWDWPDLKRQTPGQSGSWRGIQFTEQPVAECDYAVILNYVSQPVIVTCPPENVWAVLQEPPIAEYQPLHRGTHGVRRVFTQDTSLAGAQYVHSQGALPWHVERDYDFLKNCRAPEKPRSLSWITSNVTVHQGHRDRMAFLKQVRGRVEFDLWGKGFAPINDKWDGLESYRYALAVENYSGPHYWTEKIADCFLSWTMPIYYGCTNLEDYFPKESFVRIDIHDPHALETIREVTNSDRWRSQRDAIAKARELVLDRYQLFPFLADQINQSAANQEEGHTSTREIVHLSVQHVPQSSLRTRLERRAQFLFNRRMHVKRIG